MNFAVNDVEVGKLSSVRDGDLPPGGFTHFLRLLKPETLHGREEKNFTGMSIHQTEANPVALPVAAMVRTSGYEKNKRQEPNK